VLCVRVTDVRRFATFGEMLEHYGHQHVLPGIGSVHEGVALYHGFQNREGRSYKELEMEKGVVGISVALMND
jgi:ASC-1-like (ASCH) protein